MNTIQLNQENVNDMNAEDLLAIFHHHILTLELGDYTYTLDFLPLGENEYSVRIQEGYKNYAICILNKNSLQVVVLVDTTEQNNGLIHCLEYAMNTIQKGLV